MRAGFVLAVARREVLATLRDHRAVLANLLIPLLVLPLVMLGLPLLIGGLLGQQASLETEIGVEGRAALPEALADALRAENLRLVPVADAEAAVRSERVSGALRVPPDFGAQLDAGAAPLGYFYRGGGLRDDLMTRRVTDAVGAFEQTLVETRLREAGLDAGVLTPVALTTTDASSAAERTGGSLGWLIPFFITVWTLTGGQMVALDATAGEKERGTLEALLVTPVRRAEIVVGKFLATLLFGLSAALMAFIGFLVSGGLLGLLFIGRLSGEAGEIASSLGGSLSLSAGLGAALLFSSVLLAALVAALLIAITLFARSYKEAQSYVAPLSLVLVLPVVGLQFADFFSHPALYALPAFGTLLLMNDLVQGSWAWREALLAWGSSLALAALLLGFALHTFRREGVLFRT